MITSIKTLLDTLWPKDICSCHTGSACQTHGMKTILTMRPINYNNHSKVLKNNNSRISYSSFRVDFDLKGKRSSTEARVQTHLSSRQHNDMV